MPSIAIIGATGGIGSSLALQYAKKGNHLYLTGRKRPILDQLAKRCIASGASVEVEVIDLRDHESIFNWIKKISLDQNLNLFILSAGVSASVEVFDQQSLPEKNTDLLRELEINAVAPILCANALVREVLTQKRSSFLRIVLISSLAAKTGLPCSPGYSASKASLVTYAQALRRLVKDQNIEIITVLPGFVKSSMSDRYVGAKPWMISADLAANKIARAIDRGKSTVYFPLLLYWGISVLDYLPVSWQNFFLKFFKFTVIPDVDSKP